MVIVASSDVQVLDKCLRDEASLLPAEVIASHYCLLINRANVHKGAPFIVIAIRCSYLTC